MGGVGGCIISSFDFTHEIYISFQALCAVIKLGKPPKQSYLLCKISTELSTIVL